MEAKDEVKLLKLTRKVGTSLELIVGGKKAILTVDKIDDLGVHFDILAPLAFDFLRDNAKVVKV